MFLRNSLILSLFCLTCFSITDLGASTSITRAELMAQLAEQTGNKELFMKEQASAFVDCSDELLGHLIASGEVQNVLRADLPDDLSTWPKDPWGQPINYGKAYQRVTKELIQSHGWLTLPQMAFVPLSFEGAERIRGLDLLSSRLHLRVLPSLTHLTNLTFLRFAHSSGMKRGNDAYAEVCRQVPPNLRGLTALVDLDLWNNGLARMPSFEGLYNLTSLCFKSNALGAIPQDLALCTKLSSLDLSYNPLEDLTNLRTLTSLTILDMQGCRLSAPQAETIQHLTNLTLLQLEDNYLQSLPWITRLENLGSLYLQGTGMRSLPDLSPLTKLSYLVLKKNGFTDPSCLSGLIKLYHLDMSGNPLETPPPVRTMTRLTWLIMDKRLYTDPKFDDFTLWIKEQQALGKSLFSCEALSKGGPYDLSGRLAEVREKVKVSAEGKIEFIKT